MLWLAGVPRRKRERGTRLGVVVIVLLALAWVVALLPSVLKPRFETSPIDGVRNFERSMGILANTRSGGAHVPGRWVMVPGGMESAAPTSRRQRVVARRRRLFTQIVMAAGVTLILGLIPALRALWVAHLALDLFLVGYVLYLRRIHTAETQRRKVLRALPTAVPEQQVERAASQG